MFGVFLFFVILILDVFCGGTNFRDEREAKLRMKMKFAQHHRKYSILFDPVQSETPLIDRYPKRDYESLKPVDRASAKLPLCINGACSSFLPNDDTRRELEENHGLKGEYIHSLFNLMLEEELSSGKSYEEAFSLSVRRVEDEDEAKEQWLFGFRRSFETFSEWIVENEAEGRSGIRDDAVKEFLKLFTSGYESCVDEVYQDTKSFLDITDTETMGERSYEEVLLDEGLVWANDILKITTECGGISVKTAFLDIQKNVLEVKELPYSAVKNFRTMFFGYFRRLVTPNPQYFVGDYASESGQASAYVLNHIIRAAEKRLVGDNPWMEWLSSRRSAESPVVAVGKPFVETKLEEKRNLKNDDNRRFGEDDAPPEWICDPWWYNISDVCDCGCGAWDPDCDSDDPDVSDWIVGCDDGDDATCNRTNGECVYPNPIVVPETWTCSYYYYNSTDGCDCGCGAWDPDCEDENTPVFNCLEGAAPTCNSETALCEYETPEEIPEGWICPLSYFGTNDGCDCECGAPDPDCGRDGAEEFNGGIPFGCYDGDDVTCSEEGVCVYGREIPQDWHCDSLHYGTNDGCHCGCGAWDPDCDLEPPVGRENEKSVNCDCATQECHPTNFGCIGVCDGCQYVILTGDDTDDDDDDDDTDNDDHDDDIEDDEAYTSSIFFFLW